MLSIIHKKPSMDSNILVFSFFLLNNWFPFCILNGISPFWSWTMDVFFILLGLALECLAKVVLCEFYVIFFKDIYGVFFFRWEDVLSLGCWFSLEVEFEQFCFWYLEYRTETRNLWISNWWLLLPLLVEVFQNSYVFSSWIRSWFGIQFIVHLGNILFLFRAFW